jgi:hypothetical protein
MPPEALHSASATEMARATDSVPASPLATSCIWLFSSSPAPLGRAEVKPSSCVVISWGLATSPQIVIAATMAGKSASRGLKATPAASSDTWSSLSSTLTRWRIAFRPFRGMSLGLSASRPAVASFCLSSVVSAMSARSACR